MAADRVSLEHFQKTFSYGQLRKHTAKEPLRGTSLRQLHNHTEQVCSSSLERPGHVDGASTVPSFPGNATARGVARSTLTQNPKHDQDQKSANKESIVAHTSGPSTGRLVKYQHNFQDSQVNGIVTLWQSNVRYFYITIHSSSRITVLK